MALMAATRIGRAVSRERATLSEDARFTCFVYH